MWQDDASLQPHALGNGLRPFPASVELVVHHTDGFCSQFCQKEPLAIEALLDHLNPESVFHQEQIFLADNDSLHVFQTDFISWIEVTMEGYPDWNFHPGVERIEAISQSDFELIDGQPALLSGGQARFLGVQFDMAGGDRIYHKVYGPQMTMPIDMNMSLKSMFNDKKCLAARYPGRGAVLINSSSVMRMRIFPRSPNHSGMLPTGVWMTPNLKVDMSAEVEMANALSSCWVEI